MESRLTDGEEAALGEQSLETCGKAPAPDTRADQLPSALSRQSLDAAELGQQH